MNLSEILTNGSDSAGKDPVKELELSIRQIKQAIAVLSPKRHGAAIICLGESLRIVEQGLAEIKRLIGGPAE